MVSRINSSILLTYSLGRKRREGGGFDRREDRKYRVENGERMSVEAR